MQVKVTGRHMTLTEPTRAYAEEKFGRISKIYDAEPIVAEVVLDAQKNRSNPDRFVAEVTVRLKGHVVRAEEAATDMHAAIDLAADKAETQMRKYKSRVIDRRNAASTARRWSRPRRATAGRRSPRTRRRGRPRTKIVDAKPMTEEEAMLQLELLGHDFFVFRSCRDRARSTCCTVATTATTGRFSPAPDVRSRIRLTPSARSGTEQVPLLLLTPFFMQIPRVRAEPGSVVHRAHLVES